MFSATYFTYDGVFSGYYGLMLADFNTDTVVETPTFSPMINVTKPPRGKRFLHNGIKYEEMPQFSFSMISERAIDEFTRREILSWLVGRNTFKKLIIHQQDLEEYYYNCVFTEVSNIYVNGFCHGFRVTANFDSPYAYGKETILTLEPGNHVSKIINNKSDTIDEYVFPIVEFECVDSVGNFSVTNTTDNETREFKFSNIENPDGGEIIKIDNELGIITSSKSSKVLKCFEGKNWLRLRHGKNTINATVSGGTLKIICPQYVMIGF